MIDVVAQTGGPMPMADGPMWILAVTAMLMLASLSAGLLLFLRLRRGAGAAATDPVCGACGYMVRGLSTFTCPECGADLRDVGIIKSGAGEPGGSSVPVIVWVALCGAGGLFLLSMLQYKGAPNGNIGQWLAIVFVLTLAIAGGGGWLIDRWMRHAPPARIPEPQPATSASQPAKIASQPAVPSAEAITATAGHGVAITKFLTIVFIDVEDYTALAAKESRDGLIIVIRRARDLVRPIINRRRGTLVKTMGDGFLATFESPTDAVLCGREVQERASELAKTEGDKALRFRIGVATGEVALEDDDVYGDPVNLAARLQQLAPPGQVYFSEATFHAMKQSEVPHEAAGEFEVKGISGKIRAFRAM